MIIRYCFKIIDVFRCMKVEIMQQSFQTKKGGIMNGIINKDFLL